jgi:hypothetical protein
MLEKTRTEEIKECGSCEARSKAPASDGGRYRSKPKKADVKIGP